MVRSNIPNRGDVFLIDLNPVVGNEMRDRHRCVVISPREINALGMCLTVAVTTGGQFARKAGMAVNITGHETNGVALCNHVRSLDIVSRVQQKTARYVDTLDADTVDEIVARVIGIIDPT
ncbi:MAG: type II toxin-antitoxin system PemK/MazF family toxin [Hoeflea sp.]|uniref:type II toxin-antitoxin system PemK/MazF family toxin n=1 Tax=Hoeflea sp. TaxID=1940281 RepID=UPI001DDFF201|nr:type II toxin-antitoxin system PemK/MazF family toxin [Hoeflea sp.]MBU4530467.1 type II toxin-antitoxin system PemK/MazF family toxin [Alphaproteobacteria bacterium]MBU4545254.1 type II toxin-antitoxin system PemK/MazF family toxin [Alphaproteobacteria bacterium]MBU4548903.1 type II toxin-antitoxin system PemK/MazF family toxin [Alphaproteobacteria bacterium]MBV1722057.1 type II toxin-antitoxin system PemK/MazF family toxin [Hoeflea sp.]MBV1761407.1 type II toxin-antitoxin system PemK/MazF 